MADRKRDLALFNLAIDSKLLGCDVVALRVDDVAPSGYASDRATIRQKKTDRPVRFVELTDQTRLAIDEYLSGPAGRRGKRGTRCRGTGSVTLVTYRSSEGGARTSEMAEVSQASSPSFRTNHIRRLLRALPWGFPLARGSRKYQEKPRRRHFAFELGRRTRRHASLHSALIKPAEWKTGARCCHPSNRSALCPSEGGIGLVTSYDQ